MNRFACLAGLAVASAAAMGGVLETVTIDFDDLQGGFAPPVETDGLFSQHATFSTEQDHVLLVFSGAGFVGGSNPNTLTAAESVDASTFDSDIYVDFTVAVQNLSLDILSDNQTGLIGSLVVDHAGGSDVLSVTGDGNISTPMPTDLSGYIDVTRIELIDVTDEFGLSIDNLTFDVPVPAPGVLATLGLGGLAASRRRRG